MKRYDFHSHLGKTRSGDANNADQLVKELGEFGITKVGICSLSGNGMRPQNDLVYDLKLFLFDTFFILLLDLRGNGLCKP